MAYAKITFIGAMDYYSNRPDDLWDLLELPEGLDKEILIDDIIYRAGDFELLHIDPPYTRLALGAFSKKWQRTWQKWLDALNIEYNPLHNYDRTEEWTDTHTGTQNIAQSGHEDISNTGTQGVANTGTQSLDNTGNQINTNTGSQVTESESALNYNSDTNDVTAQSKTETGHKTTSTTNQVSAFNQDAFTNKDRSDTTETPNLLDTTTGNNMQTKRGDDTTNVNETINNSVTDTRIDNLNQLRTDNLTQTRTDNLNQSKTDSNSHNRTDNLTDSHNGRMYGNIGVTTSQQMLQAELDIDKWNIYEHIADMIISEFCIMIY